jgi:hypothetical protein
MALEQFARPSRIAFAHWCWLRFFARLPDCSGALDSHHISYVQLRQFGSELCVGSIASIGQHHTLGKALLLRPPDLL